MADADDSTNGDVALGLFKRWYHVPVLAGLMVFMFWTRFQNYDVFTRDGDGVWLQAVDSWYHWRATNWMIENFPWTLSFDPWTGFPDGIAPGQFGTLFDQLVVAVALVLGLGNPGESDVLMAALVAVPALAALVAVPVYLVGKRLGTRIGGLAGVGLLALFTGEFFVRSTAGQFQHHAAETLFMAVAVLAMVVALTIAERERPVWELVRRRDWTALRRPTLYSVFAGIAITLYIWVWPPGVVFVGILGLYFVLQLSLDHYRGRSPDHLAFVGVVSLLVVAVMTAARIEQPGFSAPGLDFFQPTFALLVAGGCVFMAALARFWDASDLDRRGYPVAIGVSIVAALAALAVVLPGVFDTLVNNLSGRLVPIGHSPSALTVAEVDPPENVVSFMTDQYGWAFFTGLVSLLVLAVQSVLNPEERAKYLFVLVWALVLISMGMTQVRFNYYLAVGVAVLNAHLVGFLTAGVEFPESVEAVGETVSGVEAYQVIVALFVVMLVFTPLLPPVASDTPVGLGNETGPGADAVIWEESNEWLAENTPEVGNYAGAGNADEIDYMGRYGWPADGSFDYPEGAYGVLSWWDYGHLITVQGERIPHSNPFQQNARSSSAFLTAQSESQAELYLDAIAAGESPTHESDEDELRDVVNASDDQAGIQYVMIDDESAAEKFPAIAEWTGPDYPDYVEEEERIFFEGEGEDTEQTQQTVLVGGDYYDTMLAKLYLHDADGLEHYRLVHESSRYSMVGFFGNTQASQSVGVWEDVTASPGGNQSNLTETMATFEQARNQNVAVPIGQAGQTIHDPFIAAGVKTFERVEGATITGETDAGDTVEAAVTMRTDTNRTFTYEQTAEVGPDGSFELTVSYPTDETLTPEDGYANSSVLADGSYNVTVFDGDGEAVEEAVGVDVPEDEIQAGGTVPVDVVEIPDPAESSLSNLDIAGQGGNATITAGDETDVTVDVENLGDEPGEFSLALSIDGETEATEAMDELDGGESETVTFENVTGGLTDGTYNVTVSTNNDTASGELTVEGAQSNLSNLDIAGQGQNATITAGADENLSVTVENVGVVAGEFNVVLQAGESGDIVPTSELAVGESETVTFEGALGNLEPGTYSLSVATVHDSVSGQVTVEEA